MMLLAKMPEHTHSHRQRNQRVALGGNFPFKRLPAAFFLSMSSEVLGHSSVFSGAWDMGPNLFQTLCASSLRFVFLEILGTHF